MWTNAVEEACRADVVTGVVPYLAMDSSRAGKLREFGEEVFQWCAAAYFLDARDGCGRGVAGCGRGRGSVEEAFIAAVD